MAKTNFNSVPGDEMSELSTFTFGLPDSDAGLQSNAAGQEPSRRREGPRAKNSTLGELALALVILGAAVVSCFGLKLDAVPRQFPQVARVLHLAEAPQRSAVTTSSDAHIRVWADLKTALYYCPGSVYYGRSKNGRYMTQAEAQSGNFESAERRECTAPTASKERTAHLAAR